MMTKASMLSRPGKVKQKDFKPKNNLPRLDDYSVDPPQSYWDKWNKLTFSEANYSSWLEPKEFVKVAEETGYSDMKHVEFVSNYLTERCQDWMWGRRQVAHKWSKRPFSF